MHAMNLTNAARALCFALALLPACTPKEPAPPAAAPAATSPAPATPTPSATPATPSRTVSPPGASVWFVEPQEGATVRSPVHVVFGISGMELAPAGDQRPGTGHHHLIVDAPLPPFDAPIPKDDHHLHFGNAQTEADLTLAPGPHTLQLLLGDHLHVPHEPPVYSAPLQITVVE
jgi:hypothetical protein